MDKKKTGFGFIFGLIAVIFLGLGTCIAIDEFLIPKKEAPEQEQKEPAVKEYILDSSKPEQSFTLTALPEKEEIGYIKLGEVDHLVSYPAVLTNNEGVYPVLKIGRVSIGAFSGQAHGWTIYLLPNTILVQNIDVCEKSFLTFLDYDLNIIKEELVSQMFVKWAEGYLGYYKKISTEEEINRFGEYNIPFNLSTNTFGTEVLIQEVPNYSQPC